ncbi:prolyl oligopeptidase family serine peptidase [Solilutibacter silvestris]|uniref:Alpha/beta hydrolase family protein n=1 Tax=Solilutibacter silvestris TaxID=1645665 RepID=A0A2K1PXF4_9GAMM|nr:prolyl oligopeptidase family serine peptidase [Lysobacter silvestris]PNS07459.1 Alpha/beta hydrolase family protein [Lysobacter silvestris]
MPLPIKLMVFLLVALPCVLLSACASAPKRAGGTFLERSIDIGGKQHRYQVFVPSTHAGGGEPPVIVFLHGTGERGNDGAKPTLVGIGSYIRAHQETFPAIVVFPQAPDDTEWSDNVDLVFAELDAATREFHGDRNRTYLTGLSMGGYGVWEMALHAPERFAALVPVCGAVKPPGDERALLVTAVAKEADPYAVIAQRLRRTPVWIFHGAKDDQVLPNDDRKLIVAFRAAGATDAHYTEFPDANHNSWDPAYSRTPELWTWLFAQKR